MRLKDVCDIKVDFPEADFWLVRKGSEKTVGTPTKNFSPEHIGIKVTRTDLLVPDYLFYVFMYLQQQGLFAQVSHGTLNLKNIRVSDITDIKIG
jgi:hypothetical protein